MALTRCASGHYYDDEQYLACPYCGVQLTGTAGMGTGTEIPDEGVTVAKVRDNAEERLKTEAFHASDDGKTIALFEKDSTSHWLPVTGWLVCVEGADRGRDYRLHPERNFLGRSVGMDLCVENDEKIDAVKHCSIIYEPKKNCFYLVAGDSSTTYLNGEALSGAALLSEGDRITAGKTTLVFAAYCKGDVRWEKN